MSTLTLDGTAAAAKAAYAPAELDPNATNWKASKFPSATPGALLGTDHIIGFLLHHFDLLYASLILFSAAELITGLCLRARMGAMATIILPATSAAAIGGIHGATTLELRTVNGNTFNVAATPG